MLSTQDYVRIEIETALKYKIRVIPILVDGAQMPQSKDLPPSLAPLVYLNARGMMNATFNSDSAELICALEAIPVV